MKLTLNTSGFSHIPNGTVSALAGAACIAARVAQRAPAAIHLKNRCFKVVAFISSSPFGCVPVLSTGGSIDLSPRGSHSRSIASPRVHQRVQNGGISILSTHPPATRHCQGEDRR